MADPWSQRLLERVGMFFLNTVIGPMIDARNEADRKWRTDTLREQRRSLPSAKDLAEFLAGLSHEIPPELQAPPPRPDVWHVGGYGKPAWTKLLTHGQVFRGKVLRYDSRHDGDGLDAAALCGWLDSKGMVRTKEASASYDPMHVDGPGDDSEVSLAVAIHANMNLTVLADESTGAVVIYEALHIKPRGQR